jgi:hypothetical protein
MSSLKDDTDYGMTIEQILQDRGYSAKEIEQYKKRKALRIKKMMQK